MSSPLDAVETSYELICDDCGKTYPPDEEHSCHALESGMNT